jgi:hypothetical protein
MESIEEQWNPPSTPDIMSDSWMNMADTNITCQRSVPNRCFPPLTTAA